MKITIDKKAISTVMKQAVKVASPKSTMPILTHVAIDFDGSRCTITANDGNRTYSATAPASGDPGKCTIEADKLFRAINGMASGDIEITPDQIKQGRSKLKLESRKYEDFPQPDYDESEDAGITAEQLSEALRTVQHAMAMKDVRPMLNGVHLCEGHCVATDGHRMAVFDLPYKGPSIIIPSESVRQILELTGKVMASGRQIIIESEGSRFSTGLIEAKYPDWQRVMPKEFSATVTVKSDDIVTAIKTAQLGGEQAKLIFKDNHILIQNEKAEAACDCQVDADVETAFNLQYVLDAVMASGKAEVTMNIGSGARGSSLIDGRFTVMPVRL